MFKKELTIGEKAKSTAVVSKENLASTYGSGSIDVFATPAMIAHMEKTSAACVAPYLNDGYSTVGTLVNVKHLKASGLGKTISFESTLINIDRKRLTFEVKAFEGDALIGEGIHERFIIDIDSFLSKINGN